MATVNFTRNLEQRLARQLAESGTPDPEGAAEAILELLREGTTTARPPIEGELTGKVLDSMLDSVKRGVPNSRSYPNDVRGMVRLISTGEELLVEAGGYDHLYRAVYPYEGEVFDVGVKYKALRGATRRVKGEPLTLRVGDDRLEVQAGETLRFTFDQLPVVWLKPELGQAEACYSLHPFFEGMVQALRYYSTDEALPSLTCVAVGEGGDWTPAITAADGYRLFTVDLPKGPDAQERVLIPGDFISHFKVAAETVGGLGIRTSDEETVIVLTGRGSGGEGLEFYHRAVAREYPPLAKIIPTVEERQATLRVPVADFKAAIRQLSLFTGTHKILKLYARAGEEHVHLYARDTDGAAAESQIPGLLVPTGEDEVEDVVGSYNADYLKDMALTFEQLGADELAFHWTEENEPLLIEAGDRSSGVTAQVVIMPLHMTRETIEKIREGHK